MGSAAYSGQRQRLESSRVSFALLRELDKQIGDNASH
jgi:hypothetical protein